VGERFEFGGFSLEICGRQVRIDRVVVVEMWVTGSDREGCCWRDVGKRLELGELLLERYGRHVPIRRVFIGEMWAADLDWGLINIYKLQCKTY
jgi:hypothetical protein